MSDVDDLATIVFNGEIYNFSALRSELESLGRRFATRSDTEVILAAYLTWGVQGFSRLRGMFAFAIHDHREGSTILARDAFGIKPLFWTRSARGAFFASELGALFETMGEVPSVDVTSILETLTYRHTFGRHTLYEGVERLEPGMALVIGPNARFVRHERFVSLIEEVERHRFADDAPSAEAVRERVVESVRAHTIADVPLGCFLSGGLDSSIVATSLAHEGARHLRTYSIGFDHASSETSELPHARAVARAIDAQLLEVNLEADDFARFAPLLSGTLNGPFAEPADIAMLKLSKAAANHVTVVLSGEGGDEAFGGYPKYAVDRFASSLGFAMRMSRPVLRRRGRLGIAADALAEPDRGVRWTRWFANDAAPASLIDALHGDGARPERSQAWTHDRLEAYPRGWSDMQRMQVLDLEGWLPNNLLHRGDYTTMQASLEQRVPLLDLALTPWAVALPDHVKVRGLRGKMPLRRAFSSQLPRQVLERPKSGFRLPIGEWLRHDPGLSSLAHDTLLAPQARLRTWLRHGELEKLLSPAALSSTGGAKLAWTALNLELWLRAASTVAVSS